MQGAQYKPGAVHEWLEFANPDQEGHFWRINVSFFLSRYNCIYGRGCCGTKGDLPRVSVGCCAQGTTFEDADDLERVIGFVSELTEADTPRLDYIRNKGWNIKSPKTGIPYKTRKVDGACIFSNPEPQKEGDPPMGCAFHHLADRTGRNFNDTKPIICWTNPLKIYAEVVDPRDEVEVTTLSAHSASAWGGYDAYVDEETGEQVPGYFDYWCIDTPDAYTGDDLYYRSEKEVLVRVMGEASYARLCELLGEYGERKFPMPGELVNDGKPMIASIVSLNQSLREKRATSDSSNG